AQSHSISVSPEWTEAKSTHRVRRRPGCVCLPSFTVKIAKLSNTCASVQRTFARFAAVPRFEPVCPEIVARWPNLPENCSRYSAIVSRPSLAGSHSHPNNYTAAMQSIWAPCSPAGSMIDFIDTHAFQRSFRFGRRYTRNCLKMRSDRKNPTSSTDMEKWGRQMERRATR
ncbi:MAG: hypothetical protein ACLT98_00830, partial [Eggerthellaceae bacterium]